VIAGRYTGGPRKLLSCGRSATGPAWRGTAGCGTAVRITSRSRPRCTIGEGGTEGSAASHSPGEGTGLGLPRGDSERGSLGAPIQDRKKLRTWAPPVTESLHPRELDGVLDGLFPRVTDGNDAAQREEATVVPPVIIPEITRDELDRAVRRMGTKNTAPGPDGVPGPGRVLAFAMSTLRERLRSS